mgnify:CR=1 FL=1
MEFALKLERADLEWRMENLRRQEAAALAQANACSGAAQLIAELLLIPDAPEPPVEGSPVGQKP